MVRKKQNNILVTGGCGFIGSNFIRHIFNVYPDSRIFNLDFLTYAGNRENLSDIERSRHYKFIHGDICDRPLLDRLFRTFRFSVVVHFAAETHVDRSIINVSNFIRTNVDGTRVLIEVIRDYKTPRFIHISTDEIYGDVERGRLAEYAPMKPSNPYSASKAAADLLVQSFMRTHAVPAIIVRGSNNYGPFQYPEKLVPLAITNLLDGRKVPVHGSGTQVRSWLHVADFCHAIDIVVHRAPLFEIYNVSGEEKTNLEILAMIASHLGKNIHHHKRHVHNRPGADLRYAVTSQKIQKELHWVPKHTLHKSIKDVVDWYRTNREWWLAIRAKKGFQDHYLKQARGQWF